MPDQEQEVNKKQQRGDETTTTTMQQTTQQETTTKRKINPKTVNVTNVKEFLRKKREERDQKYSLTKNNLQCSPLVPNSSGAGSDSQLHQISTISLEHGKVGKVCGVEGISATNMG